MKVITAIQTFFRIAKKLTLNNPKKAMILIFDCNGSKILIDTILYDLDYSVLPARRELYYGSPRILLLMVKKIFTFGFKHLKDMGGYLEFVYFLSCIEYINPKIVITFIDNDPRFHRLSKHYNKSQFYAIQNGIREKYHLYYNVLNSDNTLKQISITNFVCFGQYEVDNFLKYGHTVETFHCVGALQGSYYRHLFKNKPGKNKYSICFVSQYMVEPYFYRNDKISMWKEVEETVYTLLNLYLEKNHMSACIACRTSTKEEYNFFWERFGDRVTILPRKITNGLSSTYEVMDTSEVIISINSTAAFEALGWGKKVLFCFFHDDDIDPFFKDWLFSIRKPDPTEFKIKLNALIDMNQDDYEKMTEKDRKYLMNYNPDIPVHIYMRNIIKKIL